MVPPCRGIEQKIKTSYLKNYFLYCSMFLVFLGCTLFKIASFQKWTKIIGFCYFLDFVEQSQAKQSMQSSRLSLHFVSMRVSKRVAVWMLNIQNDSPRTRDTYTPTIAAEMVDSHRVYVIWGECLLR